MFRVRVEWDWPEPDLDRCIILQLDILKRCTQPSAAAWDSRGSACLRVQVLFDNTINLDPDMALNGGGGINTDVLPRDGSKGCQPVLPHTWPRVGNNIFGVSRPHLLFVTWCLNRSALCPTKHTQCLSPHSDLRPWLNPNVRAKVVHHVQIAVH